ncbi:caspase family protein [Desulfobacterales bacterium HSG17]|nr:caspase family protein [Desulfobacterales bacterium HSG17]
MKKHLKLFLFTLIFGIMTGIFSLAAAANHALLIGVGKYPNLRNANLEGPAYDINALKETLNDSFNFAPGNIVVITDEQASHSGIMRAMNDLFTRTRANDLIFIYFSGHGTSGYDPAHKRFGLEPHTGALVPYDYGSKKSLQGMLQTLVIGKRDIRPILEKLEKDRQILAVFDACYSGQTVRSLGGINTMGKARFVPLNLDSDDLIDDEMPKQYGTYTNKGHSYPYKNTIYLSAASRREMAWDINVSALRQGASTFDGNPHGALTNALLQGLKGKSDSDNDGKITYNELFQYIQKKVTGSFRQTPQVLFPEEKKEIMNRPVFLRGIKLSKPKPSKPVITQVQKRNKLILKSHNLPQSVIAAIDAIPGVGFSPKKYDILVSKINKPVHKKDYRLFLSSGALLSEVSANDLLENIRRQVKVRELINLSYKNQEFNVFLNLIGTKGVMVEGESIGFSIWPGSACHILLINVEPTGNINVLYPYDNESMSMLKTGQELSLPELGTISAPNFGTEHVKVFAFKNKPANLGQFIEGEFLPDSRLFSELMKMVTQPGIKAAQMTLKVKTRAKKDIVN